MLETPRIAINGFGRIGRMITRIAKSHRHFDVVAINDLAGPEHLAYIFKYDSVHGPYPGEVHLEEDTLTIDNDSFRVLQEMHPAKLVISHSAGDEGHDYENRLREYSKHLNVNTLFA